MDIAKDEWKSIHSTILTIRHKDTKRVRVPVKANVCLELPFGQIIVKILQLLRIYLKENLLIGRKKIFNMITMAGNLTILVIRYTTTSIY